MKSRWMQGLCVTAVVVAIYSPLLVAVAGCHTNRPLPANAVNWADAEINASLQAAHAAVVQYETDVKAGVHVPSPEEKAAVNQVIRALNAAMPLEQAYHNALTANPAAGEPAELATAMAQVTASTETLQTLLAAGKGK